MTPRSRSVLILAGELAEEAGQGYVGTEHLLLALAREGHGLAAQVLDRLQVRERVIEELQSIVEMSGPAGSASHPDDEFRVLLDSAPLSNHPLKIAQ